MAGDLAQGARFAPLPHRPSNRWTHLQRLLGVRGQAPDETFARLAPLLHRQVLGFIAKGTVRAIGEPASDAFRRTVRTAAGQAVACMAEARDPELGLNLSVIDLIEKMRPLTVTVTGDAPKPNDPYAEHGDRTFVVQVPLLEILVDRC